MRSENLDG
jgi:tetratricopeptide (TPR) repeat protein